MKKGSPYANTRALVHEVASTHGGRAVFDDQAEYDTETKLISFDVFVVFDGSSDEEFTVRTDHPHEVHAALCDDVATEYAANPTGSLGWSVSWYATVRTEGDSPIIETSRDETPYGANVATSDADDAETPIRPYD